MYQFNALAQALEMLPFAGYLGSWLNYRLKRPPTNHRPLTDTLFIDPRASSRAGPMTKRTLEGTSRKRKRVSRLPCPHALPQGRRRVIRTRRPAAERARLALIRATGRSMARADLRLRGHRGFRSPSFAKVVRFHGSWNGATHP